MGTRSIITRIFTAAAAALMLVAVSGSTAYAAALMPEYSLDGIVPSGSPNFENTIRLKVLKSRSGFRMKVNKGKRKYFRKGNYFNIGGESFFIKRSRYKLVANFDAAGNFLDGTLKIKGKLDTPSGRAKGVLMTATLGSFAFDGSTLLGFNTHDIFCHDLIDAWANCTSNESVYLDLEKSGFDPTLKGFRSRGLSVATVPVPAAVWLFGSGLLALAGVTRRRKH